MKMSPVLESPTVGFKKSDADQCLFVKIGKKGTVTLLLHVGDSCVFGARSDTDDMTAAVKRFTQSKPRVV